MKRIIAAGSIQAVVLEQTSASDQAIATTVAVDWRVRPRLAPHSARSPVKHTQPSPASSARVRPYPSSTTLKQSSQLLPPSEETMRLSLKGSGPRCPVLSIFSVNAAYAG